MTYTHAFFDAGELMKRIITGFLKSYLAMFLY